MSKDSHPWGDQVDGPWELRHAVRLRLRENPDAIKIWATGGGIWRWDSGRRQLMSTEEIKAVADECKLTGIPLWSHSYNSVSAAYDSVRFGAEQLIHGFELDDKTMNLMAEQGTFFTPTIGFLPTWYATYPPEESEANAKFPGDTVVERELQRTYANLRPRQRAGRHAHDWLRLVQLRDPVRLRHDRRDVRLRGQGGHPRARDDQGRPRSTAPRWSITRTSSARLEAGKLADLLVVRGDVARNIHDLTPENMDVIMKEGDQGHQGRPVASRFSGAVGNPLRRRRPPWLGRPLTPAARVPLAPRRGNVCGGEPPCG